MRPRCGPLVLLFALMTVGACARLPEGSTLPETASSPPAEEPVELVTPSGTLHGTLLSPAGGGRHPVALLIAGSGPTDRDGNSTLLPGENNSLKLLAEGLAQRGIATLRYDKRGIGESAAAAIRESDLRFDHFVEDAAAWTRQLRSDSRFSTVSIVGHSEGSLIGMRAALMAGADAFVSIAGVGRPAPDVLRDQLRPQLPPELWLASERILEMLVRGQMTDSVPPALAALYRPSVQPYLISWFPLDPAEDIAKLRIPVMIAQGTTDIQVGVREGQLLHAARPDAELSIIDEMNHVLKSVPADLRRQQESYSDPALPVVAGLIDRIAGFLARVSPDGPAA